MEFRNLRYLYLQKSTLNPESNNVRTKKLQTISRKSLLKYIHNVCSLTLKIKNLLQNISVSNRQRQNFSAPKRFGANTSAAKRQLKKLSAKTV